MTQCLLDVTGGSKSGAIGGGRCGVVVVNNGGRTYSGTPQLWKNWRVTRALTDDPAAAKWEDGKLTLALSGRLDTNTSPDLEAAVKLDGVEELVFDFAGLEYIASSGLRVLLGAQKTMTAKGGRMLVANPNEMVRGVFEVTGLDGIFTMA